MEVLNPSGGYTFDLEFEKSSLRLELERKQELGQFLTGEGIAAFMASLFERLPQQVSLLDAGAGDGALTLAFVKRACELRAKPKQIAVTAYELDERIIPRLGRTLGLCRAKCELHGVDFSARIHNSDFIEAGVMLGRSDLFGDGKTPFNTTILNPPYRKISSDSRARRLLREAGIETSNLYTGFLALAAKLLTENGHMVAICPRSFCNGPYFRPFRDQFLDSMSLRRLHVFNSRSKAFERDDVLQENIILSAVKSAESPSKVTISSSNGSTAGDITSCERRYVEVVAPNDPERFIHLASRESDQTVRRKIGRFTNTLQDLGIEISTGRVVDFRAREFLLKDPREGAAPLIYPCHFNGGWVHWPKTGSRKPNAIEDNEATRSLLVPSGIYLLIKRFSSKEERRRVVACIYDPARVPGVRVGFENHLNYAHARGVGLPMALAKGLAVYFNSTLVDDYFRQFNGHTQVNATDLRNLLYPARAELEALGVGIGDTFPDQAGVDALVERELLA